MMVGRRLLSVVEVELLVRVVEMCVFVGVVRDMLDRRRLVVHNQCLFSKYQPSQTNPRDALPRVHHISHKSGPSPDTVTTAPQPCAGCAGPHLRSECRFRNARCRVCQKLGHISTVCQAKTRRRRPDDEQGQPAEATASAHVVSDLDYSVFTLSGNGMQARRGAKEDLGSSPPIIVPP